MGKTRSERVAMVVCVALLSLGTLSVGARYFTRAILAERLRIDSPLTAVVWFDTRTPSVAHPPMDWEALYPFEEDPAAQGRSQVASLPDWGLLEGLRSFKGSVASLRAVLENYTSDYMTGKTEMLRISTRYRQLIGMGPLTTLGSDGIRALDDGQLYSVAVRFDVEPASDRVADLRSYCEGLGLDFLYVQVPSITCDLEDADVSGVTDFAAQNAADMVRYLGERGVEVYDVHEDMHAQGISHHGAFFDQDHHWTPETGLWVAGRLLGILGDRFGYDVDPTVIAPETFSAVTYQDAFLGEYGSRLTTILAEPEDITLYYPNYPTSFRYEVPSLQWEESGDFSVFYCLSMVEGGDYNRTHAYSAYLYGNKSYERLVNVSPQNDVHVLIVHDSYAQCVTPFMALGVGCIDSIDLRYFTGSLRSFIAQEKPDVVIVMYSPMLLANLDLTSHTAMLDFR